MPLITEPGAGLPVVAWPAVTSFIREVTHDIRNGLNALDLQAAYLNELAPDDEALVEIQKMRSMISNVTHQLQDISIRLAATPGTKIQYPVADFIEDLQGEVAAIYAEKQYDI